MTEHRSNKHRRETHAVYVYQVLREQDGSKALAHIEQQAEHSEHDTAGRENIRRTGISVVAQLRNILTLDKPRQ